MQALILALALLLASPLAGAQAIGSRPTPEGNAHSASDGERQLAEADLLATPPRTLDAARDHRITVSLAPSPLLDRAHVRLLYGVEGQDPRNARQAPMQSDGTTPSGELRFTAILHPADLAGPLDQGESLIRFAIQYRTLTTHIDAGPGEGYRYVRDGQAPTILAPTLNGQAHVTLRPTAALRIEVRLADAELAQARAQLLTPTRIALEAPLQANGDIFSWDLPAGTGLEDGDYTLRVLAADAAGNIAQHEVPAALRIDGSAPHIHHVRLNGQSRLEAGPSTPTQLTAWIEGDAATASVDLVDQDGKARRHQDLHRHNATAWTTSWLQGTGLPEGAYGVHITSTDAAGNTGHFAFTALVVDATAPTIYTTRIEYALGLKQAARSGDLVTIQVGVEDANLLRNVYAPTPAGPVALTSLGGAFYQHQLHAPASNGEVLVPVAATDAAGNTATTAVRISVDNQVPVIHEATASPASAPRGATLHVSVIATDQATSVRRVVLDATPINSVAQVIDLVREPGSTTWHAGIPILAQSGAYELNLIAFDQADNQGASQVRVAVTGNGPAIASVQVNGKDSLTTRPATPVVLEVRAPGAATATATLAEQVVTMKRTADGRFSAALPELPQGRHHIAIHVTDERGQAADLDDPEGRLTIDGTPPRILAFQVDGSSANGTAAFGQHLTLRATIQDATPINVTIIETTATGALRTIPLLPKDGEFAAQWIPRAIGVHTLRLIATDAAAWTTEATIQIQVQSTGPDTPGMVRNIHRSLETTSSAPRFVWDPPAGAAVAGYAASIDAEAPTAITTTAPVFQAPALPPGPHVLRVRAIGAQGNAGPVSQFAFTIEAPGTPSKPGFQNEVPVLNGTETLRWPSLGHCVEVQASIDGSSYATVQECNRDGRFNLALVNAPPGSEVVVRARARQNGTDGAWKDLAHYRTAATTLHLHVPSQGYTQAQARIYDQEGRLVAQVPLNASKGEFRANHSLPAGVYRVEYELQDAEGNKHTVNGTAPARSSKPWLLWAMLGGPVLGGLVLVVMRKKGAKKAAKKPKAAPKKQPTPAAEPAAEPPQAEERGIETPTAASRSRALAASDRASVGPAGDVRLFGRSSP